jgi:hypothetical protein
MHTAHWPIPGLPMKYCRLSSIPTSMWSMKTRRAIPAFPVVNDVEKLSEFSAYDRNVDFAGRIIYNEKGVEVFNFGKNKGIPVEKVLQEQPGYFGWIMNGEFPLYTKRVLTQIKLRMMTR